jgi:hypothetical protein
MRSVVRRQKIKVRIIHYFPPDSHNYVIQSMTGAVTLEIQGQSYPTGSRLLRPEVQALIDDPQYEVIVQYSDKL